MSHWQSPIERYKRSEKANPGGGQFVTTCKDAFDPYPGLDGAKTFGRNCRSLGFDQPTAERMFHESDADPQHEAAFKQAYTDFARERCKNYPNCYCGFFGV